MRGLPAVVVLGEAVRERVDVVGVHRRAELLRERGRHDPSLRPSTRPHQSSACEAAGPGSPVRMIRIAPARAADGARPRPVASAQDVRRRRGRGARLGPGLRRSRRRARAERRGRRPSCARRISGAATPGRSMWPCCPRGGQGRRRRLGAGRGPGDRAAARAARHVRRRGRRLLRGRQHAGARRGRRGHGRHRGASRRGHGRRAAGLRRPCGRGARGRLARVGLGRVRRRRRDRRRAAPAAARARGRRAAGLAVAAGARRSEARAGRAARERPRRPRRARRRHPRARPRRGDARRRPEGQGRLRPRGRRVRPRGHARGARAGPGGLRARRRPRWRRAATR